MPPQTCAKTAQKHDYPSKEHRKSYARRTGAERTFSTAKDPASNNIARGWTRLMGLAPLMLCSPACSPSATSASWPPGTPARPTTPAAPQAPAQNAAGAARPSPTWPPRAPRHDTDGKPAPSQARTTAPRLPDSPSIRMDVWKGEIIASTEEELLTGIQG